MKEHFQFHFHFQLLSLEPPYKTRCGSRDLNKVHKKYPYSKDLCFMDCMATLYNEKCGCVPSEMLMWLG